MNCPKSPYQRDMLNSVTLTSGKCDRQSESVRRKCSIATADRIKPSASSSKLHSGCGLGRYRITRVTLCLRLLLSSKSVVGISYQHVGLVTYDAVGYAAN